MKKTIIVFLLLSVCFSVYVAVVNKNSKNMTIKQKLLKAVYPAFMWVSSKVSKGKRVLSNDNAIAPISFYSLKDTLNNGNSFNFENLRGKKVLLVNTASDCGYTAQYETLEKLHKQYQGQLVVIGFPSNDFKEQETGDDSAIAQFCKINYGVSFQLMTKSIVKKSANQNSIYKWLTDEKQNGWNSKAPSWNFCKYLVNEQGNLTHFFESSVEPLGNEIKDALQFSK